MPKVVGGQLRTGVGLDDQRRSLRVFNALRLVEVSEDKKVADLPEEEFQLEDHDFEYMMAIFMSAPTWVCNPKVAQIVVALADKIEDVAKVK
jgi:hypothetical protein